jgi:serine protease Do
MHAGLRYGLVLILGLAGGGAIAHTVLPALTPNGTASIHTEAPASFQVASRPTHGSLAPGALMGINTIADLVERADPSVVTIDTLAHERVVDPFAQMFFGDEAPSQSYEERGIGSGFILDSNGLIVTNNHVIKGASNITVTFANGKKLQGQVIGADPSSDIALVRVKATGLQALHFTHSARIRVGDWVVAIGSPLGLSHSVSAGIISALNRGIAINDRVNFIQTDAAINPGNSGGPLIDLDGEVVGINTAIAAQGQNIGFAIPAWSAESIVAQLRTKGHVDRGWMGVSIRDLGDEASSGVLISGVAPSGPAGVGGLKPGDIITAVNGASIKDSRDLFVALNNQGIGSTITITVNRHGSQVTRHLTLQAMPQRLTQP